VKYGLVQGGVVPVSGASIQMYAVGTTGDGSAAAVWSLAPYMQGASEIGAGTADQAALVAAFQTASLLANPATGKTPGANAPDDATLPTAEINTLADILAACVDSTGGVAGDGSACGTLFNATAPATGNAPTNTLSAALLLANNPAQGTTTLYNLLPANPPFQPVLISAPADFSLPTTFSSGLATAVSPSSFPDTYLERSSQATLTLTNNGTSSVHLSQPVLSGANATEFILNLSGGSSPCSTTTALAAGASCTIAVTFTPTSVGQKAADLAIVSDAQNPLIHVALSGKGIQSTPAALNFSYTPDTLNFDKFGTPQTITVTNTGTEPFTLVITPNYPPTPGQPAPDGTGWSETDNCTQTPIAPSATCTLSLEMYLAAGIPQFLTLEAHAGPDVKTEQLALTSSVANYNGFDARPIDFGNWPVGLPSQPMYSSLSSVTIACPNAADFAPNCPFPTSNCSITFTPASLGTRTASIVFPGGNIHLLGAGQAPGPSIAILPNSSITSGPVGTKTFINFTVVNNGTTPATVASSLLPPTDTSVFSLIPGQPSCSPSLPQGQACSMQLQFNPSQVGSQTATIQVSDTSHTGVTATKNYTLTALPVGLEIPTTTFDIGPATLNQTKNIGIALNRVMVTLGPPTGGNASGDFTASLLACAGYNPPDHFCEINIAFTPTATGLRTTTLLVTDANPANSTHSSYTLTIQGTGGVPVLTASSNSITFPDTPVGTTSSPQTITVKNNGIFPVSSSVNFTGPNNGMYTSGPATCNGLYSSLNPGNSCVIPVFFRPTAVGPQDGTMQLGDGTTVAFHGSGTASTTPLPLSISPTALAFPDQAVGFTSVPKVLTITNVGSTAEDVSIQLPDEQGQKRPIASSLPPPRVMVSGQAEVAGSASPSPPTPPAPVPPCWL